VTEEERVPAFFSTLFLAWEGEEHGWETCTLWALLDSAWEKLSCYEQSAVAEGLERFFARG
jgi:hypothetical protein